MNLKAKRAIPLFYSFLMLLAHASFCQVRLPRLIGDSMILQRDAGVNIWGWAAAGEKVSVSFNGKTYTALTGSDGKWLITLAPLKAGGPYSMEINASNHITLNNILAGDVWVCSGQSNMELPMERVKEKYPAVIARSANPAIRQFNVATRYDFQSPQEDLLSGSWNAANPQTVLRFTAAGYFFATALYEKYHVPIGLIKIAVGGSPAEAWLSEDALKVFPAYLQMAQQLKDSSYINGIRRKENAADLSWYRNIWQEDKGLHDEKPWFDPAYDASAWPVMELPAFWADGDLKYVNGVVWFRKEIDIPGAMTGRPAKLLLGRIVDQDSVYINGVFAGTTGYQYPPRRYELPPGLLKPGKNILVVRVINSGGRGGFVKDKPYQLTAGEQTIDLKGPWQYRLGAASGPIAPTTFFQYKPGGLFNAMIAPLLNFSIKGVIWYQGESNTSKAKEYRQLLPALINNWRQKWQRPGQDPNIPFAYVQLPNFMEPKEQPSESQWAQLREAQFKTLAVPNTAMAVAIDIGEWNDIHPLNKEDVGKRLALAAEKIAYGDKKIVYSGPLYQSMELEGNKIVLHFSNTGSGLVAIHDAELTNFAIAGADKKFVWAKARIEGNKVIVWNDQVPNPVAVRYAWADNPAGANLYNKEGLPASPFRTDE